MRKLGATLSGVLPIVGALLSLLTLLWSGYVLLRTPDAGFGTLPTSDSVVSWVDPSGPAAGKLTTGERVVAVNGNPANEVIDPSGTRQAGDVVVLAVEDLSGTVREERVRLAAPSTAYSVFWRISRLAIAATFLTSGIVISSLFRSDASELRARSLMILFMYLIVAYIALSSVGSATNNQSSALNLAVALLLGVVSIDVHLWFPRRVILPSSAAVALGLWYVISVVVGAGVIASSLVAI